MQEFHISRTPTGQDNYLVRIEEDALGVPSAQELVMPVEEATELELLGEEEWDEGVDDIDYDDPEYEKDSALVTELFRQLANSASVAEPPIVTEEERVNKVWLVLGIVGITAIALVSVWWCQNLEPRQMPNPPAPSLQNF